MKTLLLDRTEWDLVLDTDGNIAVASDPYSIAQDICSAVRTFAGELWFDTAQGIPYFSEVLGRAPDMDFIQAKVAEAAQSVPQVVTATCTITSFVGRALSGVVEFTYRVFSDDESLSTTSLNSGILTFVGDNDGIITFVGDNALNLSFYG